MKDDKTLRRVIQEKISLINSPKLPHTVLDEIKTEMYERFNVKSDRTVDIFNGFEPIESAAYHMLYKLMICIKEVGIKWGDFDYSDLNESKYFNENEVKNNGYDIPIKEKEEETDLVFKDWHETNVGLYSYITIHTDIDTVSKKIRDYNKFRYNPETQRDLIVVDTNGVPIIKTDINDKAIEQIKNAMVEGSYFPVPGTLNINPELYDEHPFKVKNGNLVIENKFKIDLIEGFHNYRAYTWAKDENPDWKYPCEFRLYFMNVDDANRYILQMDKKNHFKEAQTSRMEIDNPYNYFISTLNKSVKFYLKGTMDNSIFLYLFKILPKIFKIENIPDAAKLISAVLPNLNYAIMQMQHFEIPFNKDEWFVYLYLCKQSIDKNIDFEKIIDNIGVNSLFAEIKIKNEPLPKHYKIINNALSEVITNV